MSDPRDPNTWRLSTGSSAVPYRVVKRLGEFGREMAEADETYIIPATQLLDFVSEALPQLVDLGQNFVIPNEAAEFLINFGGAAHPGIPSLRVKSVKWREFVDGKPVDPLNGDPLAPAGTYHDLLQVDVHYETVCETILEISGRGTGEFLNTTGPGAQWEHGPSDPTSDEEGNPITEDNKNPTVPVMKILPEVEWTIRWPRIPWSQFRGKVIGKLRSMLGKVNSDTFGPLFNAPPETLMFVGWDYEENYTWRSSIQGVVNQPLGTPPISISMKFLEKYIDEPGIGEIGGHNHFWKPGHGWRRFWLDKDKTIPVYQEADLNEIFT